MTSGRKVDYLTADEILSTIAHSSFPSIVTEGDDDVIVFRRLEDEFSHIGLTIIPAGGKTAVLEVFERRNRLPAKAQVLFIVDRDFWVISGIPANFISGQLLLTDGYSIENDMYRDGDLETLLTNQEKRVFRSDMQLICRWYALEISRRLVGRGTKLGIHPNELLDDKARCDKLMELYSDEVFPEQLVQTVTEQYARVLRGKTLLALLTRHAKGHSNRTLLNFGASRKGPLLSLVVQSVSDYFNTVADRMTAATEFRASA